MIALILARYGLHIGAALGIVVAFLAWDASRVHKGVMKERVRVENEGKKVDARAQDARRSIAVQPPSRVLDKYYRD